MLVDQPIASPRLSVRTRRGRGRIFLRDRSAYSGEPNQKGSHPGKILPAERRRLDIYNQLGSFLLAKIEIRSNPFKWLRVTNAPSRSLSVTRTNSQRLNSWRSRSIKASATFSPTGTATEIAMQRSPADQRRTQRARQLPDPNPHPKNNQMIFGSPECLHPFSAVGGLTIDRFGHRGRTNEADRCDLR